jgi:hypothetical protein
MRRKPARGRGIEGFSPADPLERPLRISPATVMNLTSVRERLERRSRRRRCAQKWEKKTCSRSLVVQVEDDADHYDGRDPGQGVYKVAS